MSLFKRSTTVLLVLFALFSSSVFAHTYLSSVYLDDTLLDEGDCVRSHPSTAYDSPIPLVTQSDMTCGWLPEAAVAANRKCPIAAGSTIGIQWHHTSNAADDDIIASTHKGPVIVYLAKSDDGSGNVWFKIYEDGLVDGAWGVDRLLTNNGRVDVTIPSDIASGNYLLRGEILALHSAYDLNGVQPYVGCVELTITGSGSANPTGVALPGYYSPSDPGMLVNIYSGITSYTIPGPAVYVAGSSGSSSTTGSSSSTVAPTAAATSAPTTKPSSAPTTRPGSAATSAPTTAPTTAPTGGSVKVQMNTGSNVWWFAVAVTGGSESTVKVELKDSGSVSNFYILSQASYGYYFSQSIQLTLPISIRLTSSSGKQIVLDNYVSSWTDTSVKDTGKDYTTSTSAPTSAPTAKATSAPTAAPTAKATSAPTTAPETATSAPTTSPSSVKVSQHASSSAWWLAVAVSGTDDVKSVEIKDSDSVSAYSSLDSTSWGYYVFSTTGTALVAPFSIRVTDNSGNSVVATFSEFGNVSADAN